MAKQHLHLLSTKQSAEQSSKDEATGEDLATRQFDHPLPELQPPAELKNKVFAAIDALEEAKSYPPPLDPIHPPASLRRRVFERLEELHELTADPIEDNTTGDAGSAQEVYAASPARESPRFATASTTGRGRRFILTSLFCNLLASVTIVCCVYAINLCAFEATPQRLYRAACAIVLAILLDGFNGRYARHVGMQSDFRMQLDTLADWACFGLAPALLVDRRALEPTGKFGMLIACVYAVCGACRLARFNVRAMRRGVERYFVGLPIPVAAGILASAILAHSWFVQAKLGSATATAFITVFLSVLMVSKLRYPTFNDVAITEKSVLISFGVLVAGLVLAKLGALPQVLGGCCLLYTAPPLLKAFLRFVDPNVSDERGKRSLGGPGPRVAHGKRKATR